MIRTGKKMMSLLMAGTLVVGSTTALSACGSKSSDEVVTLDVFSQTANYSGMQVGWMADVLKEKFNVELNIIPDGSGVLSTRMENGDLGDIVVWGSDGDSYASAVEAGLLFDWNEDDLLTNYGSYIEENMPDALAKNQGITEQITDGESDTLYGFASGVATSSEDHQSFFYNWDVRWDLYKELGYPEVKDLDDFLQLMKDMKKICPTDDSGNKTYAASLWSDWDDSMVMYVKATASAYYGYDEMGIGLYDPTTGEYHGALEEDGPYLEMLKFFNKLYQNDLLDPDSMTQTYDKMTEKVQNGGVFFSIFNYSGSLAYNKEAHTSEGKMMYCLKPEEATPLVYGMSTQGGTRITSIGANTEYPELCMEIINYLCTPEGSMTARYGPKGETWDYDDEGNTYFTDLGKQCNSNGETQMTEHDGTFNDGSLQAGIETWSIDAENPDSNGETYNSDNWKSNVSEAETEIEQDWRDYNGVDTITEYFEKGSYTVSPGSSFSLATKSEELKTAWSQVTSEIKTSSWKAMYAKTDAEYEKIVNKMIEKADAYGYQDCLEWLEDQAALRRQTELEEASD
ncbi:MAG: hypothetical protein LUH14_04355 [Clostridiaceae bacterium]|nr:hypothetical protein [Clostridiaceae bacterium]